MPRRIDFDPVADLFDATRRLPDDAREALTEALVREVGGRSLLEVGVGTGRIAGLLADRGVVVTGVDTGIGMLRRARARGLDRLVRGNATRLPLATGAFQVVLTTHLLHLIARWRVALGEFARVATDEYLAVLERGSKADEAPEREYRRFVRADLGTLRRPGLHEWRLAAERLSPDRIVHVGSFRQERTTAELIDALERRAWSWQWEVPDALHREAVAHVREVTADRRLSSTLRLEVAVWSVRRIASLADPADRERRGPTPVRRAS